MKSVALAVNYDHYRVFYHVGKYGSFTQAAKVLMNNQPNITRIMNNLEMELGCKLLVRSKKGVRLTPEGEKLFSHIEAAIEQISLGEEEIRDAINLKKGHISIAVTEIALHGIMLPVLQKFRKDYPGIQIQILNYSTREAIWAVERGLVELAAVSTPAEVFQTLVEIPIQEFRNVAVGGRQFQNLKGRKISLQELSEYPLISLGRNTTTFDFYNDLFAEKRVELNLSVEAATTDQILPLVKHDIGIGFLPYEFAREALQSGEVFEIELTEDFPYRLISLIRDKHRPLSAAASILEKMIKERASFPDERKNIP